LPLVELLQSDKTFELADGRSARVLVLSSTKDTGILDLLFKEENIKIFFVQLNKFPMNFKQLSMIYLLLLFLQQRKNLMNKKQLLPMVLMYSLQHQIV